MKNVKDLKEKEVILCSTQEECKAIAELLDKEGFMWFDGGSYIEFKPWVSIYIGEFCFSPYTKKYCNLGYWVENGCTIHEAKDFLPTKETTDPTKQVLQEIIKEWHESKIEKSLINLIRERL